MRVPLSRNAWSFTPKTHGYRTTAQIILELHISTPTSAGRSRSVPQQVFDVIFPSASSIEIRIAADFSGLEKASRVSSLERHGETSVPSIQECYLSPMSRRSHLGIGLSHNVDRPPEPVQGLSAPTPQRLDGEGNQAPTR